jgi:hypothetical protein
MYGSVIKIVTFPRNKNAALPVRAQKNPLICQMPLLSVYIKRSFNFDNPPLILTFCL